MVTFAAKFRAIVEKHVSNPEKVEERNFTSYGGALGEGTRFSLCLIIHTENLVDLSLQMNLGEDDRPKLVDLASFRVYYPPRTGMAEPFIIPGINSTFSLQFGDAETLQAAKYFHALYGDIIQLIEGDRPVIVDRY